MTISMYDLAGRYLGLKEIVGQKDHPLIVYWLAQCGLPEQHDEVAWCSAFINECARLLGLPRSRSASARSWLGVGTEVKTPEFNAEIGNDVVVLKRGGGDQPGAFDDAGNVIKAPGHVGLFAGWDGDNVKILAGNQGNSVSIASFPRERILGIRRLA